jgi:aminoglycoside phosphotransferase (APT) family kinase protein
MVGKERLQARIRALFPNLAWSECELLRCDHDVLILDDQFVFRFDTTEEVPLSVEVHFLQSIQGTLGVSVPNYEYVAQDYELAGYPRIDGEPLTPEIYNSLSPNQRRNVAQKLKAALDVLHSYPMDKAKSFGIGKAMTYRDWIGTHLYFYILLVRHSNLTKKEMQYCDRINKTILDASYDKPSRICIVHGDLCPEYILIDPEHTQLAGIIDFGDVAIGDLSSDFGFLWEYGEDFIDMMLEDYGAAERAEIKDDSWKWWFMRAIWHLLVGVSEKSHEHWQRGYGVFPDGVSEPGRDRDWKYCLA